MSRLAARGAEWDGASRNEDGRWINVALICVFLVGLYTHYTVQISSNIPLPSAPAGLAGLLMLWRQRNRISSYALAIFCGVILLYLLSILSATDLSVLPRRFNGLVQLSYSLVIGYGLYLTMSVVGRRQLAAIFLCFSLTILIGCLLEDFAGLGQISDRVREFLYSSGIYDADARDQLLYGRVRPKFFASEPASVTFTYALFTFVWLVLSRVPWKQFLYVFLMAVGTFAMPGPTLLLMILLLLPYALFIAGRKRANGTTPLDLAHLLKVSCLAVVLASAFYVAAHTIFSARMNEITSGNDASFFYRVRGPALATRFIFEHYPIAGAGLTGEPYIERDISNEYLRSPAYSRDWPIVSPATELVINFFFLHWIYLGLVWGLIMLCAVSAWLRAIGIPSLGFCWLVWAILGQASGAYVGPLAWSVLYLSGAAALAQRSSGPLASRSAVRFPSRSLWQWA